MAFWYAETDFIERIVRLVAFDNIASTLLLVWTGLNRVIKTPRHTITFVHEP